MERDDPARTRRWRRVLSDVLLRYGTGSKLVERITNNSVWDRIAWTLIVPCNVGWAVVLWILPRD